MLFLRIYNDIYHSIVIYITILPIHVCCSFSCDSFPPQPLLKKPESLFSCFLMWKILKWKEREKQQHSTFEWCRTWVGQSSVSWRSNSSQISQKSLGGTALPRKKKTMWHIQAVALLCNFAFYMPRNKKNRKNGLQCK